MRYFLVIASLAFLTTAVADNKRLTLEMAVYEAQPGQRHILDNTRPVMAAAVSNYPGFVIGQTFQSTANPDIYVDYYVWESLEEALDAAETVMQDPKALPFMQGMKRVLFYGHATILNQARAADMQVLNTDDRLLFRIYAAPHNAEEGIAGKAPQYGNAVAELPGAEFFSAARFYEYPRFFMDYGHFNSEETAQAAWTSLRSDPGIAPYTYATSNWIMDEVMVPVFGQLGPAEE